MESELLEITELRLGLPGDCSLEEKKGKKRGFSEMASSASAEEGGGGGGGGHAEKNGVVGWPPICSYRQKKNNNAKRYVKVSMDGAPFLRKVDLNVYRGYSDLTIALQKLFGFSRIGNIFEKDPDFSEYKPIYEDKDGDWMLAGDVPWEMFMESCRRLRIMKSSPHARLERIATRDSTQVEIEA